MRKFCVRCGAEDLTIVDGLCMRCLIEEGKLVKPPKEVVVAVCKVCSSVKSGNRWLDHVDLGDFIRKLVTDSIETHKDVKDLTLDVEVSGTTALLRVRGRLKDLEFKEDFTVGLNVSRTLCPRCVKIKGSYYEALIQVRTLVKFRESFKNSVISRITSHEVFSKYLSDIEVVKDGVDVKLLSQGVARKLASSLVDTYGGIITESWKAAGFLGGRRVSKLTISARLLGLLPGDIVLIRGEVARVHSIGSNVIRFESLASGKLIKYEVPNIDLRSVELLDSNSYELTDAKVLNLISDKAIIKDLRSGVIYELPVTHGISTNSKVKLLIYKDSMYLISD